MGYPHQKQRRRWILDTGYGIHGTHQYNTSYMNHMALISCVVNLASSVQCPESVVTLIISFPSYDSFRGFDIYYFNVEREALAGQRMIKIDDNIVIGHIDNGRGDTIPCLKA